VLAARDAALLSGQPGDLEGFDSLARYAADSDTGLE
jgi:hypothetical protein